MMEAAASRKSIRSLAESIHSLLGMKAHLTSNWVDSVCSIIKSSPNEGPPDDHKKDNNDVNLSAAISRIKDELAALTASIRQLNIQRREVLNDFLDLKGNIRVFCRVKPTTLSDNFSCLRPVVALDSSTMQLNFGESKRKSYSFDKVFHPDSLQDDIFLEVEPVIKSALDGYNVCIFAYGQTGSGKTFTMEGTADRPGVIPRAMESLFKQAADSNHTFLFSFSMLEIYMGYLKDLLVPRTTKAADLLSPCLSIKTDSRGEIEIVNLVTVQVSDFNQAKSLYRLGCRFRSTASTNSNQYSSRSHSMIRILMNCYDATERRRITNKIWMVDLGGSERIVKTKAWGRRLQEGNAINLSLSALGDVINALQKKKHHIPYRNSKLTQVLKDSLGKDSKTLMLVHVSPKEEDLCETICSLNFATRVRSTHIGNEETTEFKAQKEVKMNNLQQRIKWIEDKRREVRREITMLNEKLEDLTGTQSSSMKQLEDSHLSLKFAVPLSNIGTAKKIGNVKAAPSSELPRFMRPTICSRRRTILDLHTSEQKDPVPARRKRPSYHAESVTLPIKGVSGYNSESSISKTSCLVGSKLNCSLDNKTEGSQDQSECNVKMVVFPVQGKSSGSNCSKSYENINSHELHPPDFSKVDDWFHCYKKASDTGSYSQPQNKVLPIPNPERNFRGYPQRATKGLHEKVLTNKLSKEQIKQDECKKTIEVGEAERTRSEEVTEIMPKVFDDLGIEESRSNCISPIHINDAISMTQAQGMVHEFSIEEYICSLSTPPDKCWGVFDEKKEGNGVHGIPKQPMAQEKQLSETFNLNRNCNASSVSERINTLTEDIAVSVPISELKSTCQELPTEIGKSSEEETRQSTSQHSEAGMLKQQSSLAERANKVDLAMPVSQSHGETKSTGISGTFTQKIQILCAWALLGLGFQSLGLGHDFFFALTL